MMNLQLKELVNPSYSAVLVIDIQNDSCHPEGVYARRGWDISSRQRAGHEAAEFIKEARKYKVSIIFIKYNQSEWTTSRAWLRQHKNKGPEACLEGTWGEQFYTVEPMEGEPIVVKHRYSAFIGTDLDMILRSKGITTLIVTGGGTQACVESTVRDGFMLDYDMIIVSDCCGTPTPGEHEPALKRMADLCGTVVEAKEVVKALKTYS